MAIDLYVGLLIGYGAGCLYMGLLKHWREKQKEKQYNILMGNYFDKSHEVYRLLEKIADMEMQLNNSNG
jgi:hypothetical protein